MNHLQRHIVGYAMIVAAVVNVLIEKIETAWPHSAQDWTLLILAAIAAVCSTIVAYRSTSGGTRPINPNENPPINPGASH